MHIYIYIYIYIHIYRYIWGPRTGAGIPSRERGIFIICALLALGNSSRCCRMFHITLGTLGEASARSTCSSPPKQKNSRGEAKKSLVIRFKTEIRFALQNSKNPRAFVWEKKPPRSGGRFAAAARRGRAVAIAQRHDQQGPTGARGSPGPPAALAEHRGRDCHNYIMTI